MSRHKAAPVKRQTGPGLTIRAIKAAKAATLLAEARPTLSPAEYAILLSSVKREIDAISQQVEQ